MLTIDDMQKLRDFLEHTEYPVKEAYGEWVIPTLEKDYTELRLNSEVFRELFDQAGIIPKSHNIYDAFLNEIKTVHGIEGRHIIEVGGGAFPRLADRIRLEQKTGSITVYDPRLFVGLPETDRFVLKRKEFKRYTQLFNTDLLIGLMPCHGADALVESATENGVDFIVWLCEGGYHGEPIDYFESEEEWRHSLMCCANNGIRDNKMGKLMVKTLPEFSTYPIIYNQR